MTNDSSASIVSKVWNYVHVLKLAAPRTTAIDHLEAELDRQITRSNRLRQSVLAAAFRSS